jgi:hypothetical protein
MHRHAARSSPTWDQGGGKIIPVKWFIFIRNRSSLERQIPARWAGICLLLSSDLFCGVAWARLRLIGGRRALKDQIAIPVWRQVDVLLQSGQTRSPVWFDINSSRHIKHLRIFG